MTLHLWLPPEFFQRGWAPWGVVVVICIQNYQNRYGGVVTRRRWTATRLECFHRPSRKRNKPPQLENQLRGAFFAFFCEPLWGVCPRFGS